MILLEDNQPLINSLGNYHAKGECGVTPFFVFYLFEIILLKVLSGEV